MYNTIFSLRRTSQRCKGNLNKSYTVCVLFGICFNAQPSAVLRRFPLINLATSEFEGILELFCILDMKYFLEP